MNLRFIKNSKAINDKLREIVTVEKFMMSPTLFESCVSVRIMIGPLTYIINIITPFVLSFSHFFLFSILNLGK